MARNIAGFILLVMLAFLFLGPGLNISSIEVWVVGITCLLILIFSKK